MNTTETDSRLQQALSEDRPADVSRVFIRLGTDSTGDQAVWIWVILKDDHLLQENQRPTLDSIRMWAWKQARATTSEWPYIAFRTEAEQGELEGKAQ